MITHTLDSHLHISITAIILSVIGKFLFKYDIHLGLTTPNILEYYRGNMCNAISK